MGFGDLSNLARIGKEIVAGEMLKAAATSAELIAEQNESKEQLIFIDAKEAGDIAQALKGKTDKLDKKIATRLNKTRKTDKEEKRILPEKMKELAEQFSGQKRGEHKPDTLVRLRESLIECKSKEDILSLVGKNYDEPLLISEALEFLEKITGQEKDFSAQAKEIHQMVIDAKNSYNTDNKKEIARQAEIMTPEITRHVKVGELKTVRELLNYILDPPIKTPQEIDEIVTKCFPGKQKDIAKKAFLQKTGNILRTPELSVQEVHTAKAGRAFGSYLGVLREAKKGEARIKLQFEAAA